MGKLLPFKPKRSRRKNIILIPLLAYVLGVLLGYALHHAALAGEILSAGASARASSYLTANASRPRPQRRRGKRQERAPEPPAPVSQIPEAMKANGDYLKQ